MKFWKLRRSRWDAPMPSMEKLSAAGYYAVAEFPDGTSNDSSHFTLHLRLHRRHLAGLAHNFHARCRLVDKRIKRHN